MLDGIYCHFSFGRPDRTAEDLGVVHQKTNVITEFHKFCYAIVLCCLITMASLFKFKNKTVASSYVK